MLRCSYCIIPKVRPHLESRPIQHIVEEVARLADNGYREVVLTGIHLGHYGIEWNWRRPKDQWIRLANLVEKLVNLPGDFRIRLSSIEATEVTRELVQVIAAGGDRICPHLHVCLQSGSDSVLRRMRRRWGSRRFLDACHYVKAQLDEPCLTTDIIVGFPGETDEDFASTCQVAQEAGFAKIHIFPFSARATTPAAEMQDQVPAAVKQQRCRDLAAIEGELRSAYMQRLIGRRVRVLVESQADVPGQVVGTACRYVPVQFAGNSALIGRLQDVVAQRILPNGNMLGE